MLTSSNTMYEKIDRMIDWPMCSNLSQMLTYCSHRESLRWVEVPHLMEDSMAYRFDLSSFAPKVSRDIKDKEFVLLAAISSCIRLDNNRTE